MQVKTEQLREITDHLDDFVEKLLSRIADESEKGRAELVAAMEAAKKRYKEPTESWVYGWFYTFTRTRGPEIDSAIEAIKVFPEAYTRLQELKLLVERGGEVPESSYKYYLFIELINSVPGYKPLDTELVHPITLKIKNKILAKIDSFIYQYQASERMIEERKKELASTHNTTPKRAVDVDHVLLFNNVEEAQNSAKINIDKIHFSLVLAEDHWNISWVDLSGNVHQFELEFVTEVEEKELDVVTKKTIVKKKELVALLEKHDISDVAQISEVFAKRIKEECMKERECFLRGGSFLQKAGLLINPVKIATHEAKSNSDLVSEGVNATFVLRGEPHAYSLTWINHVGNAQTISLDKYPQLKKWLDLQNPLRPNQHPELKMYLQQVDTSWRMMGKDTIKEQVEECLINGPKKPGANAIKPQMTSHKLDLKRFSGITSILEGGQPQPKSAVSVPKKSPIEQPTVTEATSSVETPLSSKKSYADAVRMFGSKPVELRTSEDEQLRSDQSATQWF